jgi:hypothetical protein
MARKPDPRAQAAGDRDFHRQIDDEIPFERSKTMTDPARLGQYAQLIGRMQATLQQADSVLEGYKPRDEYAERERQWAGEAIAQRLAEVDELFPREARADRRASANPDRVPPLHRAAQGPQADGPYRRILFD